MKKEKILSMLQSFCKECIEKNGNFVAERLWNGDSRPLDCMDCEISYILLDENEE